jgi:hypothetical protein
MCLLSGRLVLGGPGRRGPFRESGGVATSPQIESTASAESRRGHSTEGVGLLVRDAFAEAVTHSAKADQQAPLHQRGGP